MPPGTAATTEERARSTCSNRRVAGNVPGDTRCRRHQPTPPSYAKAPKGRRLRRAGGGYYRRGRERSTCSNRRVAGNVPGDTRCRQGRRLLQKKGERSTCSNRRVAGSVPGDTRCRQGRRLLQKKGERSTCSNRRVAGSVLGGTRCRRHQPTPPSYSKAPKGRRLRRAGGGYYRRESAEHL